MPSDHSNGTSKFDQAKLGQLDLESTNTDNTRPSFDPKRLPSEKLIDAIYSLEYDAEQVQAIIQEALSRSSLYIFDRAREMIVHSNSSIRYVGAEILGNFGVEVELGAGMDNMKGEAKSRSFLERSRRQALATMIECFQSETDPEVVAALIAGLGRNCATHEIDRVCEYASHSNVSIREAVAFALPTMLEPSSFESKSETAANHYKKVKEILISLADDAQEVVREWALFGLAEILGGDDIEIINCLKNHLNEPNDDLRAECAYGLAVRGDDGCESVLAELLVKKLDPRTQRLTIEAALQCARATFVGPLEKALEIYDSSAEPETSQDDIGPSREDILKALEFCRQEPLSK